ncbi:MAG: DUF2892 domain-containing protein [Nanoarchaeota archaeon]
MKHNLGKLDRILRFALAFWWLGPFAPKFNIELVNWAVAFVGWIALIESFIGWCWVHKALGVDNKSQ